MEPVVKKDHKLMQVGLFKALYYKQAKSNPKIQGETFKSSRNHSIELVNSTKVHKSELNNSSLFDFVNIIL